MIETERCLIYPLQKKDEEYIGRLFTDEQVMQFLGGVRDEDIIKKSFNEMLQPKNNQYYWTVKEKKSGHFVGLVTIDLHHDGNDYEVSYLLLPKWWGMRVGQ